MKKFIFPILFLSVGCLALSLAAEAAVPAFGQGQPMIALFPTNSLVPSLPYGAYQACDRLLAEAIMAHGCRVRGQEEAASALRKSGVAEVEDLSVEQAEDLLRELSGEALVQLTISNYQIYERRETGRFFRRTLPRMIFVAELSGEIQVWEKGHRRPEVLRFHRTVTSQDPAIAWQDGKKMDANGFGQEVLRISLLQAIRDFHEKAK